MAENQNFFSRLTSIFRANPNNPSTNLSNPAQWMYADQASKTGITVNEESAMQLSSVFGAVRVISETIAALPLTVKLKRDGLTEDARKHPIQNLIDSPNPLMTDFTFRETCQAHLVLYGNAFIAIKRDAGGRPLELMPVHPDMVEVKIYENEKFYVVQSARGKETFNDSEMIHIVGLGFDGVVGKSVLEAAKESIGLGLAADRFGGSFFGNGANVSAVLTHPARLSDEAYKRLIQSWNARNTGLDNAHKTAILEEGMSLEKMSISPQESQFLQTRRFTVEDIARFFRIPLAYLGSMENSSTRANVEEQGIMFQKNTILPWVKRWEAELNRKLFVGSDAGRYYLRFNMDGLLRGDVQSRYNAYALGRMNGFLSVNDIREMESMPPIKNGDRYLEPLNMTTPDQQNTEADGE